MVEVWQFLPGQLDFFAQLDLFILQFLQAGFVTVDQGFAGGVQYPVGEFSYYHTNPLIWPTHSKPNTMRAVVQAPGLFPYASTTLAIPLDQTSIRMYACGDCRTFKKEKRTTRHLLRERSMTCV